MSRHWHRSWQTLPPIQIVIGTGPRKTKSVFLKDPYHLSAAHE